MDPWRYCARRYTRHFLDRASGRMLPADQVDRALVEGDKVPVGEGKYEVRWRSWRLVVRVGRCNLVLITAYRKPG
ncbi:MAG: DUF4258 domain-containing protein [Conexivisphaera sp.]